MGENRRIAGREDVAELEILVARFDQFDKRMAEHFQALGTRFDDVNHRLSDFTSRLATIEARLTSMDTRLDGKATQGLVHFWGGFVTAWTSLLVGVVVAVIKLWP
jgi:chromosome segregation ATPase